MVKASAVVLVAGIFSAATSLVRAEPIASPPSAASSTATATRPVAWKQIYEDSQTIYYVSATSPAQMGESDTESLLEFKIPQVVGSSQVWSVVSRMKLNCDQRQVVTIDNTSYALQMGTGTVIQSQGANDTWHQPEPGSLGELVWSTACGKH
jgi:hypothetical protein